jgi:uncharacterized cupredoxin-like copper-binding protein
MNKRLFALCLLLALLLTACGGKSAASTTIDVTMTEFTFTPNTFTVPAGQEITINANNSGAVVHNFVIMKLNTAVGEDFGPEDEANIYWQLEMQPGQQSTATFTAPSEPGDYQVVCRTAGHYVAGMIATLTVVAGN